MRKMKQPSANYDKLEEDIDEQLRSEVSKICDEQQTSPLETSAEDTKPQPADSVPKKKKKRRISAGDIIYKIFVIILIVLCVTVIIFCIRLIQQSQEADIHYIYHYNGTTGYEAPEGVTLDLPDEFDPMRDTLQGDYATDGDGDEVSGNSSTENEQEQQASGEPETEASLEDVSEEAQSLEDVLNGDELETGLYFDNKDE